MDADDNCPPIPWRLELVALVRDGYACRRCRQAVVPDDAREVVRVDPDEDDTVANVLLLCLKCAAEHRGRLEATRSRQRYRWARADAQYRSLRDGDEMRGAR